MKALLIKDWKLFKNQRQFFLVTGFIILMFLITSNNPTFVVSYATIMYTIFTISTISYDDHQNGLAFLFTLPVNRKEYVVEKYFFGTIAAGLTAFLVLAAMMVMTGIKGEEIVLEEVIIAELSSIMIAVVFLSFTIPIQLKFGAEKGRMAMMAVTVVVFIASWGIAKIIKKFDLSLTEIVNRLDELSVETFACAVLVICAALMLVSAAISMRFLKQREF